MIDNYPITGFADTAPVCGTVDEADGVVENVSPIEQLVGRWWVLHTKARNEKALAADLKEKHIGHFLPLVRTQRKYGRRSVEVELPLFTGYMFLCGEENDRYEALTTKRVAKVLNVGDQERLRSDLIQIHLVITSDVPVDLYPGIRPGRRCRVRSGCLKGLEGVVLRRRKTCRVYVSVDALGQSAELEIDTSLIELID